MLLEITTTHRPATDLGYLLGKNPGRVQTFPLAFGQAHVFYPEAGEERATATLLLDVDPVQLSRGRGGPGGPSTAPLEPYVNDRPYVASSFLSVAIARVYGTALSGRCAGRPELAAEAIPLEAYLPVLPCRGGEGFLRRLFEPLGYTVSALRHPRDERFPGWGMSSLFSVTLTGRLPLSQLLTHLYVLMPVLDDEKHYWVGDDEVEKLLRIGEGWLKEHPEREEIAHRFLKRRGRLTRAALAQLTEGEEADDDEPAAPPAEIARRSSLAEERLAAVLAVLEEHGAERVLDLGCGEGKLLERLLHKRQFREIVGLDVSTRALEIAAERLNLERLPERQRGRVTLLHGSLAYRDRRLAGYPAAVLAEVIEHLDPPRLGALERAVFAHARPERVIVTTPNAEYNALFPSLPAGRMRHSDHRFEWTRAEFTAWAEGVAGRFGYSVTFHPIGPLDDGHGAPTQMAIFTRSPEAAAPPAPSEPATAIDPPSRRHAGEEAADGD